MPFQPPRRWKPDKHLSPTNQVEQLYMKRRSNSVIFVESRTRRSGIDPPATIRRRTIALASRNTKRISRDRLPRDVVFDPWRNASDFVRPLTRPAHRAARSA